MSDLLHVWVTLPQGNFPCTRWIGGWTVWTLWRREHFASFGNLTPMVVPVGRLYTDRIIPFLNKRVPTLMIKPI
jgi:hypothetical protein